MKRRNHIVVLSILGALILAMVAIVPASADGPVIEKGNFEFDYTYEGCPFDIPAHIKAKYEYNQWYDQDGILVKQTWHWGGTEVTVTYNDHTVIAHESENYTDIWYNTGVTMTIRNGAIWVIHIPGYGFVSGFAGRDAWVEGCYWTNSGKYVCDWSHWSGIEINEQDVFCNYMLNGK
jgi:hypothetical protein